ncbi:hypothetical protein GGI21_003548, partial [Coemansia aciculifera]
MAFWRRRPLLLPLALLLMSAAASHLQQRSAKEKDHAPHPDAYPSTQLSFAVRGIPRQHIQNEPTSKHSSNNGRCHRTVRRYPQNCQLVRKHCAGYGEGVFNYVELYFCSHATHHAAVFALIATWLALLFVWLGVSASEYFSPNISMLAQLMHLPESLAGVTLLALGNGAPDLFSTFSAIRAGSGALALGQLIGSASFIVSVVVGATTLIVPVYKVNQLSYLRELCFFVATIGMVAVIVLSERLSRGLAICMVALYVAYVVTVMVTTYYEEQTLTPSDSAISSSIDLAPEDVSAESSPWDTQPSSDIQWIGVTGTGLEPPSQQQQQQRTHSVTASGIVDPGVASSTGRWSLNSPHGDSVSVRALGEFLHHHPKSLLVAAECSDLFDEICVSHSLRNTLTRDTFARPPPLATASNTAADHRLGYDAYCFTPTHNAGYSSPTRSPLSIFRIGPPSPEQASLDCAPSFKVVPDSTLMVDSEPWHTDSNASSYGCSQFPLATSAPRPKVIISAETPSTSQSELLLPVSSTA